MIEPILQGKTAFVFDLDGTLVDSVYQHVLAWRQALATEGIELSVWRIHRKIGMSGGLLTNMLLRETGLDLNTERIERLRRLHADAFKRVSKEIRPLPGARALLSALTDAEIPWAIATSGRTETAAPALETLGVDLSRVPVVTRDQVKHAKPDPDLFLVAAQRLGVPADTTSVVGDSVWDMLAAQRARSLAGHRSAVRRVRIGGIGTRGRLSSVRGSCGSPEAYRRSWRSAIRSYAMRPKGNAATAPFSRRDCAPEQAMKQSREPALIAALRQLSTSSTSKIRAVPHRAR